MRADAVILEDSRFHSWFRLIGTGAVEAVVVAWDLFPFSRVTEGQSWLKRRTTHWRQLNLEKCLVAATVVCVVELEELELELEVEAAESKVSAMAMTGAEPLLS